MLRDKHPFASRDSFLVDFRRQVSDIVFGHQVRSPTGCHLVQSHAENGIPHDSEYHHIVIGLEVTDS